MFSALCYGGVFVCVRACIFISMYTQIKLIYIRDTYIYIYKLCKGMCFPRFTPSDPVWEGDVPLFVTKPVTAVSRNAPCAVRDRDSFQG